MHHHLLNGWTGLAQMWLMLTPSHLPTEWQTLNHLAPTLHLAFATVNLDGGWGRQEALQ